MHNPDMPFTVLYEDYLSALTLRHAEIVSVTSWLHPQRYTAVVPLLPVGFLLGEIYWWAQETGEK